MSHYNSEQTAQLRSIGYYLQQERLCQSLTLEEIADRTYIRFAVLQSLEQGEVDKLPEKVYVQGFIRRYADILDIDSEELVKSLNAIPDKASVSSSELVSQPQAKPVRIKPSVDQGSDPKKVPDLETVSKMINPYSILLVGLILLGGLLGYWLMRRSVTSPPVGEIPVSPVEVSPLPIYTPEIPNLSPIYYISPLNVPFSVSIEVTERAWLKVTVDGETVFEGIKMSGEQETWTAQTEIILQTGNAGGVKVGLNQSPLESMGGSKEVKTVTFQVEKLE